MNIIYKSEIKGCVFNKRKKIPPQRLSMRLSVLFIVLIQFLALSVVYGNEINLKVKDMPLGEVLQKISVETDYFIVFSKEDIKGITKKITLNVTDASIEEVMKICLENTGLKFVLKDKTVIISKDKTTRQKGTNSIEVKGKVVDPDGSPLPGATVLIKGTVKGTTTNANGQYSIMVPGKGTVLVFSFIGMTTQEVTIIENKNVYDIVLEQNIEEIGEVVITGYQTMSKRELASAISTIKAADIKIGSVINVDQMLQGQIPGMLVMTASGEPSSTPTIRIRGNSSISGSKAPVWVVDGIIQEDPMPSSYNAQDLVSDDAPYLIGNAIAGVNPEDIETITVLKDASATAIYGVKGANGVVVITTKKGKIGDAKITYNTNFSMYQRPSYAVFDMMNSQERVQLSKEIVEAGLRYNENPPVESYEGAIQQYWNKELSYDEFVTRVHELETLNTDWFKILFKNSVVQNHTLTMSGGSKTGTYYASLGYSDAPGVSLNSNSRKYTGMARFHTDLSKHVAIDFKLNTSIMNNLGYYGGANSYIGGNSYPMVGTGGTYVNIFNYAYNTSRTMPCYNSDGSLYYTVQPSPNVGTGLQVIPVGYNILNEINETYQRGKVENFGGQLGLTVKLFKNKLVYKNNFSYNVSNSKVIAVALENSFYIGNNYRGYPVGAVEANSSTENDSDLAYGGKYESTLMSTYTFTMQNTLGYTNIFKDDHEINLFGGIEARSTKYYGNKFTGWGYSPEYGESFTVNTQDDYLNNVLNSSGSYPSITNRTVQIASFFGTASYTYKNRYVINMNIRSDGSNKFGSNPKYRWLPTWSVAGKWIASNEKFLKNVNWIDLFAIRASYGLNGNIVASAVPELVASRGGRDGTSKLVTASIYKMPNPDLRWEKTASWNIGLDFTLFDGRITGVFDKYHKFTSDLITQIQVSPATGATLLEMNGGKMENWGLEAYIDAQIIKRKNFTWNFSINMGNNYSKITYAYTDNSSTTTIFNHMLSGSATLEGDPIGTMYSVTYAGLDGTTGYPLFKTKEGEAVSSVSSVTDWELKKSGNIFPDLQGGFSTRLAYKGLSLYVSFTYQFGAVKRLPQLYKQSTNIWDPSQNVSRDFINRWRQPGDEEITDIPALMDSSTWSDISVIGGTYYTTTYDQSSIRVAKSDFLKLRQIMLRYNLPQKILKPLHITNLAITLQGNNLATWASSKWKGLDPETNTSSIPSLPNFNIGINVTL